jgi:hypothetical protein
MMELERQEEHAEIGRCHICALTFAPQEDVSKHLKEAHGGKEAEPHGTPLRRKAFQNGAESRRAKSDAAKGACLVCRSHRRSGRILGSGSPVRLLGGGSPSCSLTGPGIHGECHRASLGYYKAWLKNGTQAGGRPALGDTSGGGRAVAVPDGRGIGPCGRRRAAQPNGGSAGSGVASGRLTSSHVSSAATGQPRTPTPFPLGRAWTGSSRRTVACPDAPRPRASRSGSASSGPTRRAVPSPSC